MRVVITGGSGLIGGALARHLGSAGYDAVILTRSMSRVGPLAPGVRAQEWDGLTSKGWVHLLDEETYIVHLAGESIASGRWTEERKRRIRESRLLSGKAVAEAIRQASRQPRALLQASAVGYYGPRGDEEILEGQPPGRGFLADVSVDWEASTVEVESMGVRRVLLRTGVVLAKEGGALPRMAMPFRLLAGAPLGSGRQWLPWIHIADEVGAIRFLLERDDSQGPFNLVAPKPVTNRELGDVLERVLRRPSPLQALGLGVPEPVFRVMLGEMADALLHSQRVIPSRLLQLGYVFRFPDIDSALRDLFKD
ncbi:MAG TPA: TIGR01777 family oxidoreductase [Thermoanaerobaculia bacterium]|nr:TIGR01777 family oxidoreductase [Thermoanaerobaculia bacterium]